MKVQCEKCQAEYNIDESRIPPEGLQIKCPRCMATFVVQQPGGMDTAGDLFDIDLDDGAAAGGGADEESLELDLPEEPELPAMPPQGQPEMPPQQSGPLPPPPGGSSLPPPGGPPGGSSLPPVGGGQPGGSSLPPVGGPPGGEAPPAGGAFESPPPSGGSLPEVPPAPSGPAPTPGAEGQIFDFIDSDIGSEEQAEGGAEAQAVAYRIKRKSGKVFGPFDEGTVKKMLAEHQLMGNEEASTDGRTFKPLGAFDEFAQVIRELMEEPVGGGSGAGTVEGVDDDVDIEAEMAPKGVDFAEPPAAGRSQKSGPGAGTFVLISVVGLILVAGLALGFTRYGFFGTALLFGDSGGGGGGAASGGGAAAPVVHQSRVHYFQDTYAGYMAVTKKLRPKVKGGDGTVEDMYLLGLAYAALLRNYGANPAYVQISREVLDLLKEEAPDSPQRRKVEGALAILTDPKKALATLEPLLGKDTRDKEALYLAGWAAAYQKQWRQAAAYFDRATVIDPDYAKAYHALGDLQSLQGDFENAALFYAKALDKNPKHVNSAVEMARIAIEVDRDYERGEKLLATAFGKHKDVLAPSERAKAHHLRAQLYMKRHQADKVVQDLNAAIELRPGRAEFKAALGGYYLELGEFGKAKEMFDKALKIDAKNLDARLGKGRAMWRNGDIVKAKMFIQKLAKQAPEDPRPLYYLGRISEDLEQPDEAEQHYRKAIQVAPKNLLARVALARLRLSQGKLKAALEQLTKANKIDPESAVVRTGLGEVYYQQRNWRLAEVEFREAIKLDPELASAHFNLANTLRQKGEYDAAEAEYAQVATLSPRYPDLELERGYNQYLAGQHEQALATFEEAIRRDPKDDRLYVRAGLAAKALEQSQTAIKYFQSAAGLDNTNPEAYFQLGLMFQQEGEHDKALDLLKQAAELDDQRAEIRYHIGLSYLANEMVRDAADEFRAAIEIKSNYVDALVKLADSLADRYQFSEAIRHYRRVVREEPDRVEVWLALGDAYNEQNQPRKALQMYKEAYKRKPKTEGAAYRMARAHDNLGHKNKAIAFYQRAARADPTDPMPHYYLGFAYKALRLNQKALTAFKRYLRLRPDAPDAEEIRDEIYYLEQG
jgi:predicted Zn finger-like uncharacterized protein